MKEIRLLYKKLLKGEFSLEELVSFLKEVEKNPQKRVFISLLQSLEKANSALKEETLKNIKDDLARICIELYLLRSQASLPRGSLSERVLLLIRARAEYLSEIDGSDKLKSEYLAILWVLESLLFKGTNF